MGGVLHNHYREREEYVSQSLLSVSAFFCAISECLRYIIAHTGYPFPPANTLLMLASHVSANCYVYNQRKSCRAAMNETGRRSLSYIQAI